MQTQETAKPLENSVILRFMEEYGDPFKNACLLPERALQAFKTCLKNTDAHALHMKQIRDFRQQCSNAQTVIREDLFGITAVDEPEKREFLRQFQSYTESIMAWMDNAFQNHKAGKIEHERLKLRRDALLDQLSMMVRADTIRLETEVDLAKATMSAGTGQEANDEAGEKERLDISVMLAESGGGSKIALEASGKVGGNQNQDLLKKKQYVVESKSCWHNEDFTTVTWHGIKYQFNKTQACCIKHFWKNNSASEKSIGRILDSVAVPYRLKDTFRSKSGYHCAWGKMIVSAGKGCFKLNNP